MLHAPRTQNDSLLGAEEPYLLKDIVVVDHFSLSVLSPGIESRTEPVWKSCRYSPRPVVRDTYNFLLCYLLFV